MKLARYRSTNTGWYHMHVGFTKVKFEKNRDLRIIPRSCVDGTQKDIVQRLSSCKVHFRIISRDLTYIYVIHISIVNNNWNIKFANIKSLVFIQPNNYIKCRILTWMW